MDFAVFLERLGENVRRARWRKGLTQQQLAGESFATRYVADIERGSRNVTMRTVFELAALLDVRVVDLLNVGERGQAVDLAKVPKSAAPRPGRPRSAKKKAARR
jgi:transcriptional regulator with XRE-family HTH domain